MIHPRAQRQRSSRIFLVSIALAMAASCEGCFGCKTSPIDDDQLLLPRACESAPPLIEPPKLDILFVIDNSGSMREEQEAVARELTGFVDELKKGGGVPSDFNVGVVTTSIYLNGFVAGRPFFFNYPTQAGKLRAVPVDLSDGGFDLEPANGERVLSGADPAFLTKFAKVVRQGTMGSGQETPFEAVRRALLSDVATTPLSAGGNQGFLRDGARLLVVVLTDEDDCSEKIFPPTVAISDDNAVSDCTVNEMKLTPVSEYHRLFTEELKNSDGTAKELIWTAIAPVGITTKAAMALVDNGQVRNIDCPTSNQAGYRHRQMAEMFDNTLANLDSICRTSFRATLIAIGQLASVTQTIEIKNVPDERLMQFVITRQTGELQNCTLANQGIVSFSRNVEGTIAKVQFGNQCRRRADDQSILVKMLCVT